MYLCSGSIKMSPMTPETPMKFNGANGDKYNGTMVLMEISMPRNDNGER